jgi:hypothetical protein
MTLEVYNLTKNLLQKDPNLRWTASDMRTSDLYKNNSFDFDSAFPQKLPLKAKKVVRTTTWNFSSSGTARASKRSRV